MAECLPDLAENNEINGSQNQQKYGRDRSSYQTADILKPCHMLLKHAGGQCNANACQYHNGGVPQRKPGSRRQGAFFLLHKFTRSAVYRGDMIGIYGMAQTIAPRNQTQCQ